MPEVHAEPRGLHRPLAGGQPGASVVVEPLLTAEMHCPPGFLEEVKGIRKWPSFAGIGVPKSQWWWIPIPAYLIRHPSVGPILVDTGMHPSILADPAENLGSIMPRFSEVRMSGDQVLARQLKARGIEPKDIRYVVMTHLHFDHASGISEFPDASFIVSEAEWDGATGDTPSIMHGYRPAQFDYAFDYRTVDLTRGNIASYETFGRTFDLFADGTIRLAFTPGHSKGHMSVVCRLRDRDLVIAGDAIHTWKQLTGEAGAPRPANRHQWERSVKELRRFHEQHPDAPMFPGHDPTHWATLEERYE